MLQGSILYNVPSLAIFDYFRKKPTKSGLKIQTWMKKRLKTLVKKIFYFAYVKEMMLKEMMMMMMMMMMMNCFCGMVDRQKAFSLNSILLISDHSQRTSPSPISNTPRAEFEPAQNLNSGLVEWICSVVITTTPRRHKMSCDIMYVLYILLKLKKQPLTSILQNSCSKNFKKLYWKNLR